VFLWNRYAVALASFRATSPPGLIDLATFLPPYRLVRPCGSTAPSDFAAAAAYFIERALTDTSVGMTGAPASSLSGSFRTIRISVFDAIPGYLRHPADGFQIVHERP